MDTVSLNIIFLDEHGKRVYLRFNDIKSNITSTEVEVFANKLIDDEILTNKGISIAEYLGAEKITKEQL